MVPWGTGNPFADDNTLLNCDYDCDSPYRHRTETSAAAVAVEGGTRDVVLNYKSWRTGYTPRLSTLHTDTAVAAAVFVVVVVHPYMSTRYGNPDTDLDTDDRMPSYMTWFEEACPVGDGSVGYPRE